MADMGVVALELIKEFGGIGEAAIQFVDAGDPINNEFAEAVVPDEVEEAIWEFVEYGCFVVFDKVSVQCEVYLQR